MLKANYHTHVKLCHHADGMSEDYVKVALECGFEELGISDHGHVPRDFLIPEHYSKTTYGNNMDLKDFYDIYIPDIDESIKKYGDKIKILKGVEADYVEGHDDYYAKLKEKLDYMLFGVHSFKSGDTFMDSYCDVNHVTIYDYARNAVKGIESGLFNCLVHPDLFFYSYKNENGERKWDQHCTAVSTQIIEAAAKNGVYLEINCGGIRHSMDRQMMDDWLYPRREFWAIAKNYKNLKVIFGCDAHKPERLFGENVQVGIDFAKELGINVHEKMILK